MKKGVLVFISLIFLFSLSVVHAAPSKIVRDESSAYIDYSGGGCVECRYDGVERDFFAACPNQDSFNSALNPNKNMGDGCWVESFGDFRYCFYYGVLNCVNGCNTNIWQCDESLSPEITSFVVPSQVRFNSNFGISYSYTGSDSCSISIPGRVANDVSTTGGTINNGVLSTSIPEVSVSSGGSVVVSMDCASGTLTDSDSKNVVILCTNDNNCNNGDYCSYGASGNAGTGYCCNDGKYWDGESSECTEGGQGSLGARCGCGKDSVNPSGTFTGDDSCWDDPRDLACVTSHWFGDLLKRWVSIRAY